MKTIIHTVNLWRQILPIILHYCALHYYFPNVTFNQIDPAIMLPLAEPVPTMGITVKLTPLYTAKPNHPRLTHRYSMTIVIHHPLALSSMRCHTQPSNEGKMMQIPPKFAGTGEGGCCRVSTIPTTTRQRHCECQRGIACLCQIMRAARVRHNGHKHSCSHPHPGSQENKLSISDPSPNNNDGSTWLSEDRYASSRLYCYIIYPCGVTKWIYGMNQACQFAIAPPGGSSCQQEKVKTSLG